MTRFRRDERSEERNKNAIGVPVTAVAKVAWKIDVT